MRAVPNEPAADRAEPGGTVPAGVFSPDLATRLINGPDQRARCAPRLLVAGRAVRGLTTIAPDKARIAQMAVSTLVGIFAGTASPPADVRAPHRLVVRGSTTRDSQAV